MEAPLPTKLPPASGQGRGRKETYKTRNSLNQLPSPYTLGELQRRGITAFQSWQRSETGNKEAQNSNLTSSLHNSWNSLNSLTDRNRERDQTSVNSEQSYRLDTGRGLACKLEIAFELALELPEAGNLAEAGQIEERWNQRLALELGLGLHCNRV